MYITQYITLFSLILYTTKIKYRDNYKTRYTIYTLLVNAYHWTIFTNKQKWQNIVFLEISFSFLYFFLLESKKESSQVIVFMPQNVKISDKHI